MTVLSKNHQDGLHSLLLRTSSASANVMGPAGRLQMNCDRHGPYMSVGTRLTTRTVWSVCQGCTDDMHRRDAEKRAAIARAEAAQKHARQIQEVGVPARFVGRTLASFKAESTEQKKALSVATEFVSNWQDVYKKGSWLVFAGQPGTGKSHLAIAILQALMPAHAGRYMTCMELVQKIRGTWRKDSDQSEHDVVSELAQTPLLVIDEIGVQNGTDSEMLHLFDVLDKRYRDLMPTILLTNQNKDGFRQFVGDRVYDRMTECARWVPFAWPSYRPTARKEMQDA